jgi:hypothetical protein
MAATSHHWMTAMVNPPRDWPMILGFLVPQCHADGPQPSPLPNSPHLTANVDYAVPYEPAKLLYGDHFGAESIVDDEDAHCEQTPALA